MSRIQIPPYLQDEFHRLFIICNMEQKLSFLDQPCLDKLTECLNNPSNKLFRRVWDLFFQTYSVGLFSHSKDVPPYSKGDLTTVYRCSASKMTMGSFQQTLQFFANPVRLELHRDPEDDHLANVGGYFHTFKCSATQDDMDAKALLNEQLAWFVENDDGDSVIKEIYEHLATNYDDFRALHCVYSGNKSVHLHTEWNIEHLSPMRNTDRPRTVKDEYLRDGLKHYWEILADDIAKIIRKYREIEVILDPALKEPDAYRRLSWGLRKVEQQGEFFKIGEKIPQIELFTKTKDPNEIYFHLPRLHEPRPFTQSSIDALCQLKDMEMQRRKEEAEKHKAQKKKKKKVKKAKKSKQSKKSKRRNSFTLANF